LAWNSPNPDAPEPKRLIKSKQILAVVAAFMLVVGFCSFASFIQPGNTQAKFRAMYIYQVSTLTDWPAQYKNGSFVFGVYGDDKIYDELVKNYGNNTVGSQPVRVVKYTKASDIDKCHVIYVAPDKSSEMGEIVKKFKASSTLIVTESTGLLKSGAVMNFVIVNNSPRYEISKTNAAKYKLTITSTALNMAVNVE
jgi:hypothetical protein